MKRQSIISAAIMISVVASLWWAPFSIQAQKRPDRFRGDTGLIMLGPGQVLRISVNGRDGDDIIRVRFAWMKYMPAGCNADGVCRQVVQSQGTTAPVNLAPNEAASFDMQGGGGVRVGVFVALGDVTGDAVIINTATGEAESHIIMANTAGDFH